MLKPFLLLGLAQLIVAATPSSEVCTTYVTTLYSTTTTAYYVVNDILAADADKAGIYPVKSCKGFFDSEYNAFSCHNKTAIPAEDQCCFEDYGVLMATQFWDFNPDYLSLVKSGGNSSLLLEQAEQEATAAAAADPTLKSFTIHGLWNDLCDGSYRSNCNPSLEFSDSENITDIIVNQFGEQDLYNYMIKYWVNNEKSNVPNGGSIALWEHEYNKHGTCMNTLLPECFTGNYTRHENAVNFFKKRVELEKNLQTYDFLASEGIYPSLTKQYELDDVVSALAKHHGGPSVYVGCVNGSIDEIWYYHNLHGNVLTGDYKPIDSLTNTTCPEKVWYIPK